MADNERRSSCHHMHLSTYFDNTCICWLNTGITRPSALCAGEAPDEKLKINELGPKYMSWSQNAITKFNLNIRPTNEESQVTNSTK